MATSDTRVLIVDDDRKLCTLIREYLEPFGIRVTSAHTGPEGLKRALQADVDVVLLDVMLPGMDGFEVLRRIRRRSEVPVMMLTARGDETDRIVGLELGADDYLPKTFSVRELLARLRAVTRRAAQTAAAAGRRSEDDADRAVEVGDLRIDRTTRVVHQGGRALNLTRTEFDLLYHLARAAGRVLSREVLVARVQRRDRDVFDRSVDVHISSLRRKLGDDPHRPRYIRTVRFVGYMLVAGQEPWNETNPSI